MINNKFLNRTLVIAVFILFIGLVFTPIIMSSESTNVIGIDEVDSQSNSLIFFSDIFNPTGDVYIKHTVPDDTFDIAYLSVRNEYGAYGAGYAWDGLIKFDVSSMPPSDIYSATLYMYYWSFQDTNPAGRPITLYRVTSDWDETSVTWNTQPSYASQPTTSSKVPSSYGWMSWDVTDDVINFINGNETNYGWKITDEKYWGSWDLPTTRFRTTNYGDFIPYLIIKIGNPPYTPTIDGPTSGKVGVSYNYSASTTDPDGDQLYYLFDWGDGTDSGWVGPYDSGATAYESHIWKSEGTFNVKVKAKDINEIETEWSEQIHVTIILTNPPYTPTIDGPTSGKIGVSYPISASTTDPDGDQLYYLFDWGDGTDSGWVGPYDSGATAYESHIWKSEGTFIVKVKARDIHNKESGWSDPLLITLTKSKTINTSFVLTLLQKYPQIFQIIKLLLQ